MQEKYTDLAIRLICQELIRNGFKPVSTQEAYQRVYQIFGVDLNKRSEELIQGGFWKYAGEGNTKERSLQKDIMALRTVPDGQTFGIFGIYTRSYLNIIVSSLPLHSIKLLL